MFGPGVTLSPAGHPVEPNERFDGITTAPIVIESNVWIGANATITPGVRVGSDQSWPPVPWWRKTCHRTAS
jgi:acetyltransferase-like isoleucine patch superfamily enzyme